MCCQQIGTYLSLFLRKPKLGKHKVQSLNSLAMCVASNESKKITFSGDLKKQFRQASTISYTGFHTRKLALMFMTIAEIIKKVSMNKALGTRGKS